MLFPPTASATANWTEAFVRPSPFRGRHRSLSACHPLGGNPSECKTRIRARLRWRIVFASSVENLASSHHRGSYVRKQVRASRRGHHSRSRDSNSSSPQCRFDSSGDRRAPDAASLRARPAPHAQRPDAGLQRRSCCWRPVRLLFAQALLRPIALRTGSTPPRAAPALVAQAPRPVLLAPHRLSAGNGCVVWGGVGERRLPRRAHLQPCGLLDGIHLLYTSRSPRTWRPQREDLLESGRWRDNVTAERLERHLVLHAGCGSRFPSRESLEATC